MERTKTRTAKTKKSEAEVHGDDSAGFDLAEISSIVRLVKENDITELRLERGSGRLWLKRELAVRSRAYEPAAIPTVETPRVDSDLEVQQTSFLTKSEREETPAKESQPVLSAKDAGTIEITSPMVGTFYRRPAVDADPYVQVGDFVKKGTVLCIVEAMKLMNEIESTCDGQIAEICLEDGQMVEYGEPLFRVKLSP